MVKHSRKGTFVLRVVRVDDVWIDGVIVNGTTRAMLRENVRTEGEEVILRASHIISASEMGGTK